MFAVDKSQPEVTSFYAASIARVDNLLEELLPSAESAPQPLHQAMRHAVLAGGKRLRPQLLLAVAGACHLGAPQPSTVELVLRAACAVELVHAASLVHDDLPCFDDAAERRGRPTVHRVYGQPLAILTGDALLCLAFEVLADAPEECASRALKIARLLGAATGSREGVIGGQSIEQGGVRFEPSFDGFADLPRDAWLYCASILDRYHAMKSGALFKLAAEAGAVAVGVSHTAPWAEIGRCFGISYQLIDDLFDCFGTAQALGKPVQRDSVLRRPNAVHLRGEAQTRAQVSSLWAYMRRLVNARAQNPAALGSLMEQLSAYLDQCAADAAPAAPEEQVPLLATVYVAGEESAK